MDREVCGSNPGGVKVFCTHKEKLIYARAPDELNCLACRSRAILPTFVGLCLRWIFFRCVNLTSFFEFPLLQVFIVRFDVLSFNLIGYSSLMVIIGVMFCRFNPFCSKLVLSMTLALFVFKNNYRIF